jgi:hypothetical protein
VIHRLLVAGLLFVLSSTGGSDASEVPSRSAVSRPAVDFHGFVNWDFWHRRKLKGWMATARAIQGTLDQCYPGRSAHTVMENGTSGALNGFLHSLPTRTESELSVVYLASHQSPEGKWDFVQRKLEPLSTIAGDSNIPGHPVRIVIVDACYAAAFRRDPVWERAWQSSFLFAADADEETQELNFRSPQPVDLGRRYPAATAWLNQHMGKGWDGKLSFLGFVWVQAFVTSKGVPVSQDGWREFLRRCEQTAREFRQNADRRLASSVTFVPLPTRGVPIRERRK